MKLFTATLFLLAVLGWWYLYDATVSLPEGILVKAEPKQTAIKNGKRFSYAGDYKVTPLAQFQLDAKVLGKSRYHFDKGADVAPFDFALGWGIMSDQRTVDALEISQSARFYYYQNTSEKYPVPLALIGKNSSNMHMVPASDLVYDSLSDVKIGSIVKFYGKLVRIEGDDGWRWNSSLTRDDTGSGACELFYVESLIVLKE